VRAWARGKAGEEGSMIIWAARGWRLTGRLGVWMGLEVYGMTVGLREKVEVWTDGSLKKVEGVEQRVGITVIFIDDGRV
jgi:hypothetical protein